MSFLREYPASGLVPMQDADTNQNFRGDKLGKRSCELGVRVLFKDVEGRWEADDGSVGDILGAIWWKEDRNKRPCPAWMRATPVILAVGDGAPTTGGSGCGVAGPGSVMPQIQVGTTDDRFLAIDVGQDAHLPKMAGGKRGILLPATEEFEERYIFCDTDPRLIAPTKGDPSCASLVSDLTPESNLDPLRAARLHTIFRIVKATGGVMGYQADRPLIALEFDKTECDLLPGHGHFSAKVQGVRVHAAMDQSASGPLFAGFPGDQHEIGDSDTGKINSAHIHTNAYFWGGPAFDAPLFFEGAPYSNPDEFPYRTRVHLNYDAQATHPHVSGIKQGMWKWEAESPWNIPDEKVQPLPPSIPPPPFPPNPPPPVGTGGGPLPSVLTEDDDPPKPSIAVITEDPNPAHEPHISTHMQTAMPIIIITAINHSMPAIDYSDLITKSNPGKEKITNYENTAPVTIRIEGYSAHESNAPSTIPYTQEPCSKLGKWRSGTADGGIIITTPETSGKDWKDDTVPATTSVVTICITPGVSIGLGKPDFTTGGIDEGVAIQISDTGRADIVPYTPLGVATDVIMTLQDGFVGFPSLTPPNFGDPGGAFTLPGDDTGIADGDTLTFDDATNEFVPTASGFDPGSPATTIYVEEIQVDGGGYSGIGPVGSIGGITPADDDNKLVIILVQTSTWADTKIPIYSEFQPDIATGTSTGQGFGGSKQVVINVGNADNPIYSGVLVGQFDAFDGATLAHANSVPDYDTIGGHFSQGFLSGDADVLDRYADLTAGGLQADANFGGTAALVTGIYVQPHTNLGAGTFDQCVGITILEQTDGVTTNLSIGVVGTGKIGFDYDAVTDPTEYIHSDGAGHLVLGSSNGVVAFDDLGIIANGTGLPALLGAVGGAGRPATAAMAGWKMCYDIGLAANIWFAYWV